ncbi:AMP-dependent synthetase/ligase [Abditibacterium utsteinense]|uniref:AMP-dependent synthetase/ligase n=1 Tax=Abditibacterium utsteinense TaxID=1960156 RepID=UPI000CFD358D|nr:long-chain fatty acid--CoA ligase [Abditibacterium utsteinense]
MFDPNKAPATLPEMAHRTFTRFAARPYLGVKNKQSKQFEFATYAEIAARVKNLAGAFLKLDLERGTRVAILGENGPEWAILDLACQMCGLIVVPLFSSLPPGQIQTILADCSANVLFAGDSKQAQKIAEIRQDLPHLSHVFEFSNRQKMESEGAAFLAENPGLYEATWPAALPDDIATIIYTSGTTGEPKGVMLCHRSFIVNAEGILTIAPHLGESEVFLSFLPLAHVYERLAGHFLPLRLGASIAYCESIFTVDKNLVEARPTMMTCVPRLYESTREKLLSASGVPKEKRETYLAALQLAVKSGLFKGHFPGAPSLSLVEKFKFALYNRLVYSKIRERFGGRLKHFISGGAPIAPELGALFLGLGLEVLEGYGLTETAPVIAVNRPGKPALGTVGPPLPGVEVRIAGDGEILTRGACVMKGYWEKPEATSAAIDEQGWFHTGDIGVLVGDNLKITDRKKDLLVLANGKNVAPQPIEIRLQESQYIAQAVLLGDQQKSVAALLVPNFPVLHEWAKTENMAFENDALLIAEARVLSLFKSEIEAQTSGLADFEKIRKFVLLPAALSIQNGELTPTLKVKRRVVAEKYGALVSG